ncbi:hypothetical protein QYE76_000760 [Lolium multiflorum]|uniref:Peptidase A1 domain-containing protein n=1 Tax=Lolium multiflorum TaxID=4521 RepID=A0AAD8VW88_LOLMU|nr:hypothetical protein QYE76_000760 [Lolium multiflorum]
MAAASSILLLLLLLVAAPLSSVASIGKVITYGAKAVRPIAKKATKAYMKNEVKERIQDLSGQTNNDGQLGSSAASSYGALVFELSLGSGTSAQNLSVVMDITSELVWAQCDRCSSSSCVRQTPADTPTFISQRSHSFNKISCNEKSCQDFIRGPGNICRSAGDRCEYTERFVGSGSTSGYLANETFTFGTTAFPDMLFGCGGDIRLPGLAVAGASGFAGFSRSPLSLVSQLDISQFSYLIDNSGDRSFLSWSIGQAADTALAKGSRITPLLVPKRKQNPYWYYVKLTGVKVNDQLLTDIPAGTFDVGADGSGGVFLSTTLPVTYLEQAAYNVLRRGVLHNCVC